MNPSKGPTSLVKLERFPTCSSPQHNEQPPTSNDGRRESVEFKGNPLQTKLQKEMWTPSW